jgi:hypothetical protein
MSKSYNEQGFLTSTYLGAATTSAAGVTGSLVGGLNQGVNGKIVGTSTSKAGAAIETARAWLALGLAAILL